MKKGLKYIVNTVVPNLVFTLGPILGVGYLFGNSTHFSEDSMSFRRTEGVLGNIVEFRSNYLYDKFRTRSFVKTIEGTDGEPYGTRDGKVDLLGIRNLSGSYELVRERHYDDFKEEFDMADKKLGESLERSKEIFAEFLK